MKGLISFPILGSLSVGLFLNLSSCSLIVFQEHDWKKSFFIPGEYIVLRLYLLIQVVGSIDEIPSRYAAAVRIMKNHGVSKFSK